MSKIALTFYFRLQNLGEGPKKFEIEIFMRTSGKFWCDSPLTRTEYILADFQMSIGLLFVKKNGSTFIDMSVHVHVYYA